MDFWVTRAKDNMQYEVVVEYQKGAQGKILSDELIKLRMPNSLRKYPELMRRVVALVEVDGKEVEMVFLTNNLEWSAANIVELYRCRWQIEVFFKQIKQTLQLADFLGTSDQRGALADLDGIIGLSAFALCRFLIPMEP